MKSTHAFAVLFAMSFPAAVPRVARAADPPATDVAPADAKAALERFTASFASKFTTDRIRALTSLAKVQHPTVAAKLLEVTKDADEAVRASACTGLANQRTSASRVAPALAKIAFDVDEKPKVIAAATGALGPLGHKKSAKDVEKLLWHDDDSVVCAALSCFALWKDPDSLGEINEYFQIYPDEKSFATITVNVDTGAAGNTDQAAAQAKGRGKAAALARWRQRPECSKALQVALKAITGHGFRRPEDLKSYMDQPKKYRDPERIVDRMDEPKRKVAHDAFQALMRQATAESKKEFPGETPSDERAKSYWKNLTPLREEFLKKQELRLSELDVLLEEGKSKNWVTERQH